MTTVRFCNGSKTRARMTKDDAKKRSSYSVFFFMFFHVVFRNKRKIRKIELHKISLTERREVVLFTSLQET